MDEIKEMGDNKKNKNLEMIRLVRNIREFESLHNRICGEDCIHLKKFS